MEHDNSRIYRSGVGIILLNRENLIFAGKRIDNKLAEAWQMPQGGIDEGEDVRKALFREMFEEIGTDKAEIIAESKDWLYYDLPIDLQSKLWGGKYKGQQQKWFVLRFTGEDSDINIDTHEPEFYQWKWTNKEEIISLAVSFKQDLYKMIFKEFEDILE